MSSITDNELDTIFSSLLIPGGYSGFQVTGMIEGFFLDLKFPIPEFFWVGKFGNFFFGGLI